MQEQLIELNAELETALAIETLEYHDRNHLAGNPQTRSQERQRQLKRCLHIVKDVQRKLDVMTDRPKGNATMISGTPSQVADQLLRHGPDDSRVR